MDGRSVLYCFCTLEGSSTSFEEDEDVEGGSEEDSNTENEEFGRWLILSFEKDFTIELTDVWVIVCESDRLIVGVEFREEMAGERVKDRGTGLGLYFDSSSK